MAITVRPRPRRTRAWPPASTMPRTGPGSTPPTRRVTLPLATPAHLYHSVNALTLLRYYVLANASDAPTEVRYIVRRMIEEVLAVDPYFLGAPGAPLDLRQLARQVRDRRLLLRGEGLEQCGVFRQRSGIRAADGSSHGDERWSRHRIVFGRYRPDVHAHFREPPETPPPSASAFPAPPPNCATSRNAATLVTSA